MFLVYYWIYIILSDATLVCATQEPEETFFSPQSSPRVLDDPVVPTIFRSVSYNEDAMVQGVGRAIFAIVDTRFV